MPRKGRFDDDDAGDGTDSVTGEYDWYTYGHPLTQAAHRSVRTKCQLNSHTSPDPISLPRLSYHDSTPQCEPDDVAVGGARCGGRFERRRGRERQINSASIQVQWQLLRPETTARTTRI